MNKLLKWFKLGVLPVLQGYLIGVIIMSVFVGMIFGLAYRPIITIVLLIIITILLVGMLKDDEKRGE